MNCRPNHGESGLQKVFRYFGDMVAEAAFIRMRLRIGTVEGFLVPGQEKWLYRAARSLPKQATIVEIGAYKGKSTASLALGCLGSSRHVFSIDMFGGSYEDVRDTEIAHKFEMSFLDDWQRNMSRLGVLQHATALQGDSKTVVRNWTRPIHLLFIDGSHKYEDVVADFENFFPYVVEGGLVALHDVTASWLGPYQAWHEKIQSLLVDTGSCGSLAYGRKLRSSQVK